MRFVEKLRHRNIPRVATAYLVSAWLLIQIADTIFPNIGLSSEGVKTVIVIAGIGFFPFLVFAWLFEFTPEGLKRERDVERSTAGVAASNRKLDILIIVVLVVALAYFTIDKFLLDPRRDVAMVETAVKSAVRQVEEDILDATDYSLAVLPFVNMSSDPEQEYFSDRLSEELLNLLARIPELRVAART